MPYDLNIRGWMLENELLIIEDWAKQLQPNSVIVELGSLHGRSAYCFAATATTSVVHCFDAWRGWPADSPPTLEEVCNGYGCPSFIYNSVDVFKKNISMLPNIKYQQVCHPGEIKWDGTKVDLCFIDLLHSNPTDWIYIEYWLPLIKNGGCICGHDRSIWFPDVFENVSKLQLILNNEVITYENSSLWRINKK